jgi:hypothetical protein
MGNLFLGLTSWGRQPLAKESLSTKFLHISAWITAGPVSKDFDSSRFGVVDFFAEATTKYVVMSFPFVAHRAKFNYDKCLAIYLFSCDQFPVLLLVSQVNGVFERIGLFAEDIELRPINSLPNNDIGNKDGSEDWNNDKSSLRALGWRSKHSSKSAWKDAYSQMEKDWRSIILS